MRPLGAALGALLGCASAAGATGSEAGVAVAPDATCSGLRTPTEALGVDPATGCPRELVVTHRWSARRVCERVEPACDAPRSCRFDVRLVAPTLPGCRAPSVDARYAQCRCEFGVVECSSRSPQTGEWPGCVNNSALCYDCDG